MVSTTYLRTVADCAGCGYCVEGRAVGTDFEGSRGVLAESVRATGLDLASIGLVGGCLCAQFIRPAWRLIHGLS